VAALALASHGFYLAGSAGYFLCLWATRRGTFWVGLLVVLPVVLALAGVLFMDARIFAPYKSVLGSRGVSGAGSGWRLSSFWGVGTGLHCAALGLALSVTYWLTMLSRKTYLPVRMGGTGKDEAAKDASWVGCKRLIYAVVAPVRSYALALVVGV